MGHSNCGDGRQREDSQHPAKGSEREGDSLEGFAEAISTLEKLNRLESDIATMISSCKVPAKETRKFLRCTTPEQATNIALFQYMAALFMQLGIDIEISRVEPYMYCLLVKNSAISDLYSGTSGHTCHLVCEAISRFFNRDLNLGCSVKETKCVNAADKYCEFEVIVDREDFCRTLLSDEEKFILKELGRSTEATESQASSGISPKELEFRLAMFRKLDLVGEDGKATEFGIKCSSRYVEEEDVDTPWKEMGELSSAISSAVSFAEASHLSMPAKPEDSSHGAMALDRKEVKGYRSFAELLAKQVDKESESEGF